MSSTAFPERYLGDGVYASFDGHQIWLGLYHHRNQMIALEPEVFNELLRYQADITMMRAPKDKSDD